MNKDFDYNKPFLEEQLRWCKEQDSILEEIEMKLHEMKRIAEYALEQDLATSEIDELNEQFKQLKEDVSFLNEQLRSVSH